VTFVLEKCYIDYSYLLTAMEAQNMGHSDSYSPTSLKNVRKAYPEMRVEDLLDWGICQTFL